MAKIGIQNISLVGAPRVEGPLEPTSFDPTDGSLLWKHEDISGLELMVRKFSKQDWEMQNDAGGLILKSGATRAFSLNDARDIEVPHKFDDNGYLVVPGKEQSIPRDDWTGSDFYDALPQSYKALLSQQGLEKPRFAGRTFEKADDLYRNAVLGRALDDAIQNSGLSGFNRAVAGTEVFLVDMITDPLNLIPGLGVTKKAATIVGAAGRALPALGVDVLKAATSRVSRGSARRALVAKGAKAEAAWSAARRGEAVLDSVDNFMLSNVGRNTILIGGGAISGAGYSIGSDYQVHKTLTAYGLLEDEWEPDIMGGIAGTALGAGLGFLLSRAYRPSTTSIAEPVENLAIYAYSPGAENESLRISKGLFKQDHLPDMTQMELADSLQTHMGNRFGRKGEQIRIYEWFPRYEALGLYDVMDIPDVMGKALGLVMEAPNLETVLKLFPNPDNLERVLQKQAAKIHKDIFTPTIEKKIARLGDAEAKRLEQLSQSSNPADWKAYADSLEDFAKKQPELAELSAEVTGKVTKAREKYLGFVKDQMQDFNKATTLIGLKKDLNATTDRMIALKVADDVIARQELVEVHQQRDKIVEGLREFIDPEIAQTATTDQLFRFMQTMGGMSKHDPLTSVIGSVDPLKTAEVKKLIIEAEMSDRYKSLDLSTDPEAFVRVWANPVSKKLNDLGLLAFADNVGRLVTDGQKIVAGAKKDLTLDFMSGMMFEKYNPAFRDSGGTLISVETRMRRLETRYVQSGILGSEGQPGWEARTRKRGLSQAEEENLFRQAQVEAFGGPASADSDAAWAAAQIRRMHEEIEAKGIRVGTLSDRTGQKQVLLRRDGGGPGVCELGENLFDRYVRDYTSDGELSPIHKGTIERMGRENFSDPDKLKTVGDMRRLDGGGKVTDYMQSLVERAEGDISLSSNQSRLHGQARQAMSRRMHQLDSSEIGDTGFEVRGTSGRASQPDFTQNRKIEQEFWAENPEALEGNAEAYFRQYIRTKGMEVELDEIVFDVFGRRDLGYGAFRSYLDDVITSRSATARSKGGKGGAAVANMYDEYRKSFNRLEKHIRGHITAPKGLAAGLFRGLAELAVTAVSVKASAIGAGVVEAPFNTVRAAFRPDGMTNIMRTMINTIGPEMRGLSKEFWEDSGLALRTASYDVRGIMDDTAHHSQSASSVVGRARLWGRALKNDPNQTIGVIRDISSTISLERWLTTVSRSMVTAASYSTANKRLKNVQKFFDAMPSITEINTQSATQLEPKIKNAMRVFGNSGDARAYRQANLLDQTLSDGYKRFYEMDSRPFQTPTKMRQLIAQEGNPQTQAQMEEIRRRLGDLAFQEATTYAPAASALEQIPADKPGIKAITMFTGYARSYYANFLPRVFSSPMHRAAAQMGFFVFLETLYQSLMAFQRGTTPEELEKAWTEETDTMLLHTIGSIPFLGPYTSVASDVAISAFEDDANTRTIRVGIPGIDMMNQIIAQGPGIVRAAASEDQDLTPGQIKLMRRYVPFYNTWQAEAARQLFIDED